ncbi:hypothetical protein CLIM01_14433 [Colletotrichum limetticola]|uniref:Uncharacterized protein n=1 Tax=Colletotrichum limetticola TaxID=1209924 RepID=A0ABQ9P8J3_9PEZI|nr:hypothetical protein CLIM01_14433 [Colletotrichum limetticola]
MAARSWPLIPLVIERVQNLQRGPYKIDQALRSAAESNENSIEKIILETSEPAWRAYYTATKGLKSDHGFSGKAKMKELVDDLSRQPIDEQRDFATQLALHITEGGGNIDSHGAKRRRMCYTLGCVLSSNTYHRNHNRRSDSTFRIIDASPRDVYVGAPLQAAEEFFHEHFWDSVRRIPNTEQPGAWLADISMVFQQGHIREHFGCQMEIGIAEEKVAGLAFEYFGVKVETKDGVRSVRVNGGGKIEPDPSIKLRACRRELSGIFRNDLHEGACTSPIYQRENKELRNRTDGVSMTIPAQAKDAGRITVFLGEWRASKIKTKFYG